MRPVHDLDRTLILAPAVVTALCWCAGCREESPALGTLAGGEMGDIMMAVGYRSCSPQEPTILEPVI